MCVNSLRLEASVYSTYLWSTDTVMLTTHTLQSYSGATVLYAPFCDLVSNACLKKIAKLNKTMLPLSQDWGDGASVGLPELPFGFLILTSTASSIFISCFLRTYCISYFCLWNQLNSSTYPRLKSTKFYLQLLVLTPGPYNNVEYMQFLFQIQSILTTLETLADVLL